MFAKIGKFLDGYFAISKRKSSFLTEFIGALTTFAAMSYILVVNPAILAATGMDKAALVTVTALAAALGCLFMAIFANMPIALAPAMGSNTYFAIIVCVGMGLKWQEAMGLVFYNGLFFLIISLTGIREKLIVAVPKPLQIGLQCGIGLFIAFFGLQSAKLIVADPNTLVTMTHLNSSNIIFSLIGIALVCILIAKKVKGAIILTIFAMTLVALVVPDSASGAKMATLPDEIFSVPHSIKSTFFQLDFLYPYREFSKAMPVIITLLMLDMFDSIATVIAMGRRSGLMNEKGYMQKLGLALTVDACATVAGAVLGTSTTGAYVESSAGIQSGAKTGLSSIFVGMFFILALFISPIINAVPSVATAPALVIVGILMMQAFKGLNFDDFSELIPAVFCMVMVALSFKISEGFAFGVIAYVLILVFTKRGGEITVSTWMLFSLMCLLLTVS